MSSFWWLDASHKQQGPVDATQAIGLVKTGQIRADTQVWTEGMAAWAAAKDAPVLGEQFRAAAPPPPPVTGQPAVRAPGAAQPPFATSDLGSPATGGGQLQTTITVWGLFWRSIVVVIGDLLVIPSPWTSTMFRRYVATTTEGPDGRPFEFAGQPGDIWWVFVLIGLCELASQTDHGRIASLISIGLGFLVLRWFIGKLRPCGQTLEFTGGFWPYIGFVFLSVLSVFTIVGWAWVSKAFIDWQCRNIAGPVRFEFRGTAVEILWRGFAAFVGCMFVLPIPWLVAWIYRWGVSQVYINQA